MTWTSMSVACGLALAATIAAATSPVPADDRATLDEVRAELEALKAGQQAIRDELEALRRLLERGRPSVQAGPVEPVELTLQGLQDDPARGDQQAELLLIEYADYQCPFCQRHLQSTMPEIEREYLETGRLRYVFRDFPLEAIHPHALKAAEAANCAGEQDSYWAMHATLFANVRRQAPRDLQEHARALDLDLEAFADCLVSGRYADEVRQDIEDGQRAGVRGTPTFFLGVAGEQPGTARVMLRIRGAQPYPVFKDAIERSLAELERRS